MMDYFDANIKAMIAQAEAIGGKLQLIVVGDINDADYVYGVYTYTPVDFQNWGIDKVYKTFYKLVSDVRVGRETAFQAGDWGPLEEAEEMNKEFVRNVLGYEEGGEYALDKDIFSDHIPHCGEMWSHTIENVRLQVIADER